jgi:hypothetical protein
MKDFGPAFGLPPCLRVPIAAVDAEAIERLVGKILRAAIGRGGQTTAILVAPFLRGNAEDSRVKLWSHPNAAMFRERLFPKLQVWVHVDFEGYRSAYKEFGLPEIPKNYFLDHIQNREAVRLREYSHPFLRLCPVFRNVNTSGGHSSGGEGMEKAFLDSRSPEEKLRLAALLQYAVQYADPMDLTKMLDIPPGTQTLPGVRDVQDLFYPV